MKKHNNVKKEKYNSKLNILKNLLIWFFNIFIRPLIFNKLKEVIKELHFIQIVIEFLLFHEIQFEVLMTLEVSVAVRLILRHILGHLL